MKNEQLSTDIHTVARTYRLGSLQMFETEVVQVKHAKV